MNKNIKRNAIISSLLIIVLCLSLLAGATFALFTSESKVNISVTSGKVNIVANIENLQATHPEEIKISNSETTYEQGLYAGTATCNENTIELNNMVPGDKVTFDIVIKNYSTISVKFKTTFETSGDEELVEALNINVGRTTDWSLLPAGSEEGKVVNTINCEIELPCEATCQEKSAAISLKVEAVQGNVDVQLDENILYISNADQLVAFANEVKNGATYDNKSVYLLNDIDVTGKDFKGIGCKHVINAFSGTFDGQGHTISGINYESKCPETDAEGNFINGCYDGCDANGTWDACAGLFTYVDNATIKNVTVKGATLTSDHYAGGIVAYAYNSTIENCQVINSVVTAKVVEAFNIVDNGDKAGGIAGFAYNTTIDNCKVKDTTINGYRDLGGICGIANDYAVIKNCQVLENVIINVDKSRNSELSNYASNDEYNANSIAGRIEPLANVATSNSGDATINYNE